MKAEPDTNKSEIEIEVRACMESYFNSNQHLLYNAVTGEYEAWQLPDFLGVMASQLCDWFDIKEKSSLRPIKSAVRKSAPKDIK